MNIKTLISKVYLTLLIREFNKTKHYSDIKYDHDGGHSYSYISSKLSDNINKRVLTQQDLNTLEDVMDSWLSENEQLPECMDYCSSCN